MVSDTPHCPPPVLPSASARPQPLARRHALSAFRSLPAAFSIAPSRRLFTRASLVAPPPPRLPYRSLTCPTRTLLAGDLSMDSSSEDENEGMHPQVGGKVRPLRSPRKSRGQSAHAAAAVPSDHSRRAACCLLTRVCVRVLLSQRPMAGGKRPMAGGKRPAVGGKRPAMGGSTYPKLSIARDASPCLPALPRLGRPPILTSSALHVCAERPAVGGKRPMVAGKSVGGKRPMVRFLNAGTRCSSALATASWPRPRCGKL